MVKVTSTGIPALDKALMNGVPRGYTLLVTGAPGTGLELFAKHFAATNQDTENVVYFTTTERDEDLLGAMEEFGFHTKVKILNIGRQYYETVLAQHLEISRYRQEGITLKDVRQFETKAREERRVANFLTFLTHEFSKLRPPFRAVIDSLDFFFENYSEMQVLSTLRTIKAHTQVQESVTLVTMVSHPGALGSRGEVEEIVDGVIELERIRAGDEFKRSLVVRKMRNHPEKAGIYPYEITKQGITPTS